MMLFWISATLICAAREMMDHVSPAYRDLPLTDRQLLATLNMMAGASLALFVVAWRDYKAKRARPQPSPEAER